MLEIIIVINDVREVIRYGPYLMSIDFTILNCYQILHIYIYSQVFNDNDDHDDIYLVVN